MNTYAILNEMEITKDLIDYVIIQFLLPDVQETIFNKCRNDAYFREVIGEQVERNLAIQYYNHTFIRKQCIKTFKRIERKLSKKLKGKIRRILKI